MLRFKEYINFIFEGSDLSKPELLKRVSSGSAENIGKFRYEVFANKIWSNEKHILKDGNTIVIKTITMGGNEYKASNPKDKQQFIDDFEKTEGKGIKVTDPKTLLSDFAKTPEYGGKGGGTKISESTQEIMTCAVVLLGKKYDEEEITVEDAAEIIKEAKKKFNDIKGVKGKESLLDQFTDNWYDLATAISASNAILKEMKGTPTDAFWTGKEWVPEIAIYNADINNVKDYNSSDIVIKGSDNVYYGFSLKKKESKMAADPTLINKPITGGKSFIEKWINPADYKKIERAKEIFFTQMIIGWNLPENKKKNKKAGKFGKSWGQGYKEVKKLSDKEFDKEIRKIPNEFANDMLRGVGPKKNIFWKTVDDIIHDYSRQFVERFLKLTFRLDLADFLKDIKDASPFKFYLLTGIGKHKGDSIGVESADVKPLTTTIEKLSTMFSKGDKAGTLSLGRTKRTIKGNEVSLRQPWEYEKSEKRPAKLFYTIYNGDDAILNIELRYKGSKTVEPQFQATATANFKNLFGK